tara:strand:+ start:1607 stop:1801 length:195 start_codon:yes stop_codon:yes gene_type:complete
MISEKIKKQRKTLTVSVLNEKPDKNWEDWDLESFYLREHLENLIEIYGIDFIREELNDCESFSN